jgi:transcription elongation factor Elf1
MITTIKRVKGEIQQDNRFTCSKCAEEYLSYVNIGIMLSRSGNMYDAVPICKSCWTPLIK